MGATSVATVLLGGSPHDGVNICYVPGPMSGSVKVLAFAGARDVLGTDELTVEVEALTVATAGGVMDVVVARHPELGPHRPTIRLAVNGEYVEDGQPVRAGDEVALIPPVAGG